MASVRTRDFDLAKTLDSGQVFRYYKHGDGFVVAHRDKVFFVRQDGDILHYQGVNESFITHFFRLDEHHEKILDAINKDIFVNEAIKNHRGLRILRQDPWECLVSFVCSSASNIPKIRMNVDHLCRHFGAATSFKGDVFFTFPSPGDLIDHDKIRSSKTGFRSMYLHKINSLVDGDYFRNLKNMSHDEARKALIKLPGVGVKVADCVLLFSLGFDAAFPIDTWVQKVMQDLYFPHKRVSAQEMQEFAIDYFGRHAGYAQQYLFHWRRNLT